MAIRSVNLGSRFAGATLAFSETYAAGGLIGVKLTCSFSRHGALVGQCSTTDGGVLVTSDTSFTVLFRADQTAGFPLGALKWDVQANPSVAESSTIVEGRVTMMRRITTRIIPSSNTAAAAASLAAPTLSAAGLVPPIQGVVASTIQAPSIAAIGAFPIFAAVSKTISPPTLAAIGGHGFPLDGLSATPAGLWCCSNRLRSGYAGALFRVRRASDNAEQDISTAAGSSAANVAALATFCSGTNGYVRTIYDQSGNSRDIGVATASQQPLIYDSVLGAIRIDDALAPIWDPNDDLLSRADACGLSGAIGITSAAVWTSVSPSRLITWVGGGNNVLGRSFQIVTGSTNLLLAVGIEGGTRTFNSPDWGDGVNCTIARLAAGASITTATLRRNGSLLTEQSNSTAFATTLDMANTQTWVGRATGPFAGRLGAHAVWGSSISDADADIWDAMAARLYPSTTE